MTYLQRDYKLKLTYLCYRLFPNTKRPSVYTYIFNCIDLYLSVCPLDCVTVARKSPAFIANLFPCFAARWFVLRCKYETIFVCDTHD